ncbi:MAG: Lipoprotein signal peptidase [Parcubacteria group bacterium GW2011_GWA2_43_17]|nr:MAG: Lipoprotein signal peptidase [Parcubacteria group bacterium GW2011_GWA2_43_17]KKT90909.1 MAG: Lipoprotein signal peptidase [Parcubacteria group bacterium GW2011_GWF2_45_11]KKT97139.1 MAG: Lipoprotein signal peptidase [Parcubacteria group bacterium GW2011_GWC2_45_15]OGY95061.1 MAG: hypothetical protein A3J95_00680 [Candidatus Komeilibacteria bacterium RIFOXYC2_FULL_45_12]HAH04832.1 signal peptidase II [Candidatus Komeilibacteria bacterium]
MAVINLQKNKLLVVLVLGSGLFIIDRLTKYLAFKLPPEGVLVFKNFNFTLYLNQGIAFSLPLDRLAAVIIAALITLGLIYFLLKSCLLKKYFYLGPLILIIIGAASNLIDRLKFQGVVDFIDIWVMPAFNLADLYIVAGIIWLILISHSSRLSKKII